MPKILVIEDMPDSADLAAQILQNYGHEVLIAETGERGLNMAAEHLPDLIIYDYWLPDLDARSFLSRLRADVATAPIKVIVCTATPIATMQQSMGEHNFDGFILKPYRLTHFMQEIEAKLK